MSFQWARAGRSAVALAALGLLTHTAQADEAAPKASEDRQNRQSLEDAWWTGPILAAGAGTLPKGHFLVEPYVFANVAYGRYDDSGERSDTADARTFGSLTYLLYGLADCFTVGLIPRFGFNDLTAGRDSSSVRVGDLTLLAQYRLTQFREGRHVPTLSLVVRETLPTGKYDRLGDRPSDAFGSGSLKTEIALHSQYYFWMPNGRILRTRLNLAYGVSTNARVEDESVYGTAVGFRGRARAGNELLLDAAWEYSVTRNWVLAFDFSYHHGGGTRLRGLVTDPETGAGEEVRDTSPGSRRVSVAPAVEYNWNGDVGIIAGAIWSPAGRNADARITPVVAVNMFF